MTVASNPPYDQYTATGGQTVFNYTFEIVENTDLLVYQTPQGDAPNDLLQLLTFNVDYTVTGVGAENGGTVVLNSGATLGDIITIKQNVPVQRDTAFTPGGVLRANDLNSEFDNQTLIQQLTRFNEQQRMLRYWDSAIVVPYVDTILPVLGANQIWAKNPNNDEIIPYDVPPDGGLAPDQGTYIVQTPNGSLPNAVALSAYGSGFMANTAAIGFTATRVLVPTLNQINISNPAGLLGNPIFSIAPNVVLPGTAGMGIPEGTTAQRVTPLVGIGMRFNTDLQQVEAYIGGVWVAIPSAAAGLFLPLAGGTMSGDINMDANFIHNLPVPVDPDDAATKNYVDTAVGGAAGGSQGNIQWNNSGAFAGDPNFNTDGAGNIYIDGVLDVDYIHLDGNRISPTSGMLELEDSQLFNDMDADSNKIINLAICTAGTDAANKDYVDQTALNGTSVYAATTTNLTVTQSGAGAGATLTNAGAQAVFAIDGVSPPVGSNVLVKNLANAANEGIYTVTDVGSVSTNWILTRATSYDTPIEINNTGLIIVRNGSTLAGTAWYNSATIITVDTTNFSYSSFGISLPLSVSNGGSGRTTLDTYRLLAGGTTNTGAMQSVNSGSNGQLLQSKGNVALPDFTTATYPTTTTANRLLYSSSNNVVAELTTGTGVNTALGQNVSGSGSIALTTSPVFTTPTLGAASATSISFGSTALSAYETGNWTPTLTSSTPGDLSVSYSSQIASYQRIGNFVYFNCILACTPTYTTATGIIRVAGLPITVGSNSPVFSCMIGGAAYTAPANIVLPYGGGASSSNQMSISYTRNNNSSVGMQITQFASGSVLNIYFSGVYAI